MNLGQTVKLILAGEDQASSVISGVSDNLDGLSGKMGEIENVTQPFADGAEGVWKAEAAVVALGAGLAALAINQAGSFSDQFAEISTLTDETADHLDTLRVGILDYSRDSGASIESINNAVYTAISAGADWEDSLEALNQAEKLSVAGKADLQSSTLLLSSTMNAYGADISEVERYSDSYFQTVRDGLTTLPELAAGMAQVTGIAASAGVPIEDLNATISALTASGLPTAQAITGIKAALTNIISPSAEAAATAEALNIKFDAQALKSQGLAGMLDSVQEATGGNISTMSSLFGSVEGLNAMMVLSTDSSGRFADALEHQADKAGATETAYEKMADTMGQINQQLINNMQATLVQIGLPLLDDYGNAVAGLEDIFESVGVAIANGSFSDVSEALESFLTSSGKNFSDFAKVLPQAVEGMDFSGVLASFDELGDEVDDTFKALFGDVDLTTAEGVKDVLQKIVNGIEALTRVTTGSLDGLGPFLEKAGDIVDTLLEMDDATWETTGKVLGLGTGVNVVAGLVGEATGALSGFGNLMNVLAATTLVNLGTKLVTAGGGVTALTASASSLAVTLGPAILGSVLFTLSYQIGKFYGGLTETQRLMQEMVPLGEETAATHAKVGTALQAVSEATGLHISSMDELLELEKAGKIVFNESLAVWDRAPEPLRDYAAEVRAAAEASTAHNDIVEETTALLSAMGIELDENGQNLNVNAEAVADNREMYIRHYESLGNSHSAAVMLADSMGTVSTSTSDTTTELEKAATASESLQKTMLELASDERIKSMELAVDLKVAKIEAETAQIEAAFESVNTGITSTGDTLSSLTDSFANFSGDMGDKWKLEGLMDDESEQRKKEFKLQEKLIEAQVDLMEKRADAMKNGDGLIKIDGTGLAPELHAFMWKVIEGVQLQANEEGVAMLTGG